jgi:hypothetical protein
MLTGAEKMQSLTKIAIPLLSYHCRGGHKAGPYYYTDLMNGKDRDMLPEDR